MIWALEEKFGAIDPQIRKRIAHIVSVDKLKELLLQVFKIESIDQLKW